MKFILIFNSTEHRYSVALTREKIGENKAINIKSFIRPHSTLSHSEIIGKND